MSYDQTAIMNIEGLTSGLQPIKNYIDNRIQNTPQQTTSTFLGATSLTGGASGVVPAPQAGDESKFLCADGTWKAIQGGGGSYPIASASNAGLMSAEDKQHLDYVFQSTTNFVSTVMTEVSSKMLIRNLKDNNNPDLFLTLLTAYFNQSTQLLPNISYIFPEIPSYQDSAHFIYDNYISFSNDSEYQKSNTWADWTRYTMEVSFPDKTASIVIGTESSVMSIDYASSPWINLSESVVCGFQSRTQYDKEHTYSYDGITYMQSIRCTALSGTISLISTQSISPAAPSAETAQGTCYTWGERSIYDSSHWIFFSDVYSCYNATEDDWKSVFYYTSIKVNPRTGTMTRSKAMTNLGTYYYDIDAIPAANQTLLSTSDGVEHILCAGISYNKNNSKIEVGYNDSADGLFTYTRTLQNAKGSITGGGSYVIIHHGIDSQPPTILQLDTIQNGVTNPVNDWIGPNERIFKVVPAHYYAHMLELITVTVGQYNDVSNIPCKRYTLDPLRGIVDERSTSFLNMIKLLNNSDIRYSSLYGMSSDQWL